MKKFLNLMLLLCVTASVFAKENKVNSAVHYDYGKSIIFTENHIEFAIYPDGQFDFHYQPATTNVNIHSSNVNISFNSGYDYDPYIQYDDYGAIVQIENVPIYYDYYGRIIQAGNVNVNYNNSGRLVNVGGLHVYYDSYGHFSHFRGYINPYNRAYVYRPWHRYYTIPLANHCIVYARPYRAYYHPHRVNYEYYRNHYVRRTHRDFYSPNQDVAHYRRGETSTKRRSLARNSTRKDANYAANNRNSNAQTTRRSTQNSTRRNSANARNGNREVIRNSERSVNRSTTSSQRNSVSTSRNKQQSRAIQAPTAQKQSVSTRNDRGRTKPNTHKTRTLNRHASATRRR
ncbi:hypothetical protein ACFQ3R_00725 [Mesonia ostreae]|uniref:Sperm nuclear basic protein PL-I n=1 Tax=Mesonia ostreae TaxID=861110 RepID=A0ABU2KHQ1_9FLAO|nr:hypothetical protein [Mesonia ostreae]MDT0294204.1 hypothetical protein [Mesonia ostreae]